MSDYNYVIKFKATTNPANSVPALKLAPKSLDVFDTACTSASTVCKDINDSINATKGTTSTSYTNDLKDIFLLLKKLRKILNSTK